MRGAKRLCENIICLAILLLGSNEKRRHLFRNCNHFASDLCEKLTGKPAPDWVNRLAWVAEKANFLVPTNFENATQSPVTDPAHRNLITRRADARTDCQDLDPDSDD